MRMLFVALSTALAIGAAAAQSPAAFDAPFIDAAQIFQRASKGEKSEVEPAIAAFEALARAEPRNPVYAVYLGSAVSLKGREAWMPWNKIKFSEQGLDHIDRALEALKPEHDRQAMRGVPVSLETRFVAASTFIKLPDGIFHRRAADLKLLDDVQRHPAFPAAAEPFRSAVKRAAAEATGPGK